MPHLWNSIQIIAVQASKNIKEHIACNSPHPSLATYIDARDYLMTIHEQKLSEPTVAYGLHNDTAIHEQIAHTASNVISIFTATDIAPSKIYTCCCTLDLEYCPASSNYITAYLMLSLRKELDRGGHSTLASHK